jgi:hypothetical protein
MLLPAWLLLLLFDFFSPFSNYQKTRFSNLVFALFSFLNQYFFLFIFLVSPFYNPHNLLYNLPDLDYNL